MLKKTSEMSHSKLIFFLKKKSYSDCTQLNIHHICEKCNIGVHWPIKQNITPLTLLNTNVLSPLSSSSGVGGRGRLGALPGPITVLELDEDPKSKLYNLI